MLKLDKIKEYKIYIFIAGIVYALFKAKKYGENRVLFKQNKNLINSIKKSNETDEIIKNATPNELSKLL